MNTRNRMSREHVKVEITIDGVPLFSGHMTERQEKAIWDLISKIEPFPNCMFNVSAGNVLLPKCAG